MIGASGATVCVCYQLPLDPIPADAKAKFITKACNAYHAHVAAMRDLLGNRPPIQEHDGRIICIHCGRDYTDDDMGAPESCDIDDCPSYAARMAVAAADGSQLAINFENQERVMPHENREADRRRLCQHVRRVAQDPRLRRP